MSGYLAFVYAIGAIAACVLGIAAVVHGADFVWHFVLGSV